MASIRDTVRNVLLNIDGDSGGAEDALGRVAAGLQGIDGETATATVELARKQFDEQLAKVNAELEELSHRKVEPKVKLKVDTLRADAEMAAKEAEAAFARYFQPKIAYGRKSGILGDIGRLTGDLEPVLAEMTKVGAGADQMATDLSKGGFSMGELAGKARDFQEIGMLVVITIVASMVPAIIALTASLLAAIAGAGALATAFAASLGPAVLGAIAVFTRFAAILNVAKELQLANRNAAHEGATANQKAAAAERARHAAIIAIRDATESVTQAEAAYGEAVKAAEKQIADAQKAERQAVAARKKALIDANRSEGDAHRKTINAQKALKVSVKDALTYWIGLLDKVYHDQLDLEGSQLDVRDATDALSRAQAAYNSLLNEIPSDKLGEVLQKLQDVNLPEDQVKSFITAAMGKDADPAFAEKLYTAQTALLHAQHDLKVATEGVRDATYQLSQDQKELNGYTKNGTKAYGPYKDAVVALANAKREENRIIADNKRAIAQATAKVIEAKKAVAQYAKEGVKGQTQVKNAANAVRTAEQHLADAHWNAAHGATAAAGGAGKLSSAASRLRHDLAALSPAEREVLYALVGRDGKGGLKGAFKSAFGTDTVMHAFAGGIRGIAGLLKTLSPELHILSGAFGLVLKQFAKALGSKAAISFFKSMIGLATQLTLIGGGAFKDLIGALAQIAKLAAPGLVKVFEAIAGAMARFLGSLKGPGAKKTIDTLIDSFMTWGHVLLQVITGFGKLIVAIAPFGNQFAKWLGNAAEALGNWASSKKGRDEIKSFFADTLPLAKSVATFLFSFGRTLVNVFQFLAPIIKPIVDAFTDILNVVGDIFGWLNKVIPRPVRELVGLFGTMVSMGPKLLGWLGKIPGLLGDVVKWIGGLDIIDAIAHALDDAGNAIGDAATAIGKAIWAAIKAAVGAGLDVGKWIIDALGDAASFGAKILGWVADGIAAAAKTVGSVGGAVATWIANGLGAIGGWGVTILKAIDSAIKSAIKTVGGAGSAIAQWIVSGIKSGADFGASILKWIANGIASAAKGAAHIGGTILKWIWRGIKGAASIGGDVLSWIAKAIASAAKGAAGVGRDIVEWIWKGISKAGGLVGRIVKALWSGASNLVKLGAHWASQIWNGLKSLPATIGGAIWNAISSIIPGWVKDFVSWIKGGGGSDAKIDPNEPGWLKKWQAAWAKQVAAAKKIQSKHAVGGVASSRSVIAGDIMGDAGPEALIPLKDSVLAKIGLAIAASTPSIAATLAPVGRAAQPAFAMAGAAAGEHHEHLHVHGAPETVNPDPRTTLALIDQRRRRRGSRG